MLLVGILILGAILYLAYQLSELIARLSPDPSNHASTIVSANAETHTLLQKTNELLSEISEIVRGENIPQFAALKRKHELMKLYEEHLASKEGLSKHQAMLKAHYVVHRFDEDSIAFGILLDQDFGENLKLSSEFESSETYAKDIQKAKDRVTKSDMYKAIWQAARDGAKFLGKAYQNTLGYPMLSEDTNYHQFIMRKAIISKLIDEKLIVKANRGSGGDYSLNLNSIDQIQDWYTGMESLEWAYSHGTLLKVFSVY